MDLGKLLTEQRNDASRQIDSVSTVEMLGIINREDQKVASAVAEAMVHELVSAPRAGRAVAQLSVCQKSNLVSSMSPTAIPCPALRLRCCSDLPHATV